jgi:hypothetical protein
MEQEARGENKINSRPISPEELRAFAADYNLCNRWFSETCAVCGFVHAVSLEAKVCTDGQACVRCGREVDWS